MDWKTRKKTSTATEEEEEKILKLEERSTRSHSMEQSLR
jgi:hypothetical protein